MSSTAYNARPQGRLVSRAGLWAVVGPLALAAGLAVAACFHAAPATSAAEPAYGTMPAYLKKIAGDGTDAMLTGTAARPALTSEGDTVKVMLPGGGSVRMDVTGPVVPGEGLPFQADYTTCTWTITLSHATKNVPIVLTDMSTLDQVGTIYRLSRVPHEAAPPTSIGPGQSETFEVRADMKVGEGLLRWAPGATAGSNSKILAEWDFEVEND
ncbi:hypothetical protein [Frondihabitans australicus]|uniref:Uncharacterized protein n=1 Tax=Frondihabitans australicus TaxID=386892 RepID=A0A495IK85_9MICO|nr:hypothetical protein [Frondihabitans australicus]RKR76377.1 hypothetical protein C8E83_3550 [Frondihabitans australicus]